MIMCADHHCNIDLCGCDADEQYRRAQAASPPPPASMGWDDDLVKIFCVSPAGTFVMARRAEVLAALRPPLLPDREGELLPPVERIEMVDWSSGPKPRSPDDQEPSAAVNPSDGSAS